MSVTTEERGFQKAIPEEPTPARGWLLSPWLDVLFVANIAWPLLAIPQASEEFVGLTGLQFWQLYYVTTPHRWITLFLVYLDRERFRQRSRTFLAISVAVVAVCLGVRLTTGALTCLLTVDYLWNAWHFAAQHHGVYRIYARLDGPDPTWGVALEKWALRGFFLYVTFRVASVTWSDAALETYLRWGDWMVLLVPAWLLLRDARTARAASPGRLVYLVSVTGLYLSLLWAAHERRPGLVLSLATASAVFHAVEYLALVTWSVRQRSASMASEMGILGFLAPRWGLTLAAFVLILGAGGWLMDERFVETWLLLNVIVAFLHYAYDGLIWRRSARSLARATPPERGLPGTS